jgi:hypothetical protein
MHTELRLHNVNTERLLLAYLDRRLFFGPEPFRREDSKGDRQNRHDHEWSRRRDVSLSGGGGAGRSDYR